MSFCAGSSKATKVNYAVTCFVKGNNKKLCSIKFLPFYKKENEVACMFHCRPTMSEVGAVWFRGQIAEGNAVHSF